MSIFRRREPRPGAVHRAAAKLAWGARVVGWPQALSGVGRYALLRLRRPATSSLTLRNGIHLDYAYPEQAAPALIVFRDYIDPEYDFLNQVLTADSVVVDVGAAIGQFSTFAAHAGARVVHAVEPVTANIKTLTDNVSRNGFDGRVEIHQVGLADYNGTAELDVGANTYTTTLDVGHRQRPRSPDTGEGRASVGAVPVRRLDDLLHDWSLDRVDVLKVNVAGHEHHVLDGARESLVTGRVAVLVLLISANSRPWYERLHTLDFDIFFYHPPTRTLHRVTRFDPSSLADPPWPARHLIAINRSASVAPHLERRG